jgi:hypothetical protein
MLRLSSVEMRWRGKRRGDVLSWYNMRLWRSSDVLRLIDVLEDEDLALEIALILRLSVILNAATRSTEFLDGENPETVESCFLEILEASV